MVNGLAILTTWHDSGQVRRLRGACTPSYAGIVFMRRTSQARASECLSVEADTGTTNISSTNTRRRRWALSGVRAASYFGVGASQRFKPQLTHIFWGVNDGVYIATVTHGRRDGVCPERPLRIFKWAGRVPWVHSQDFKSDALPQEYQDPSKDALVHPPWGVHTGRGPAPALVPNAEAASPSCDGAGEGVAIIIGAVLIGAQQWMGRHIRCGGIRTSEDMESYAHFHTAYRQQLDSLPNNRASSGAAAQTYSSAATAPPDITSDVHVQSFGKVGTRVGNADGRLHIYVLVIDIHCPSFHDVTRSAEQRGGVLASACLRWPLLFKTLQESPGPRRTW
ncbi:hypothetical protein BJ912DRAFT_930068 [Pholiota molesta]|nr:hypothetical protein BJ912DRAFT_930068 [Pholiota molesta]